MNKHEHISASEVDPEEGWPKFRVQFYRDDGSPLQQVTVRTLSKENAIAKAIKEHPDLDEKSGGVQLLD